MKDLGKGDQSMPLSYKTLGSMIFRWSRKLNTIFGLSLQMTKIPHIPPKYLKKTPKNPKWQKYPQNLQNKKPIKHLKLIKSQRWHMHPKNF